MSEPWIAVGIILSPHGTGGAMKVLPYSDFPHRYRELKEVFLEGPGGRRALAVEAASPYGRFWLVKLAGINAREEAGALRGKLLLIPPAARRPLPPGSYYFDQIIGLKVYDREGVPMGEVTEVKAGGAHDHYVVRPAVNPDKKVLLPAVKQFVKEINLEEGRMVVEPPDGLLDL